MKRIFVAIDISEEARQRVSAYIGSLRNEFRGQRIGWVKPEKLHLTLKFLGDIDEHQLAHLKEAVEITAKQISSFTLPIADTGVFPSAKKARTLWLDLKDEKGNLLALSELLEAECEKIGFTRERRIFKPHLTIARLKERSKDLVEKHLSSNFEPVEFDVSEIVIYESKLQPTGSVYSAISRNKLQ